MYDDVLSDFAPEDLGLVIDNFAGGGGASLGIQRALGRNPHYAINHSKTALQLYRRNLPETTLILSSVWKVNPRLLCAGRPVDLGWFSPDCTWFSKARGGKPFLDRNPARRRRGLAWLIPYWMKTVRPRVVMLENVEEFSKWGKLLSNGQPDPADQGATFRKWIKQIQNLGYSVDMRELRACDYGAPTTRKRLFIICRCDGQEIVFPEATHGPFSYQRPYRTAAECIDWSIPCHSIFMPTDEARALGLKRPLVEATLRRIARGIERFVINDPHPFIVTLGGPSPTHFPSSAQSANEPLQTITPSGSDQALAAPVLINTRNGERHGRHGEQAPRVRDIRDPMPTVTAQGSQGALAVAFLARHYGGHENKGASLHAPLPTITTRDHHALVTAFLMRYNGKSVGQSVREPISTIDTRDRFALVKVLGHEYRIDDILTRHLTPRELFLAQSFPPEYIIDHGIDEHGEIVPFTNTAQIHMCGNSVPPIVSEALVRANVMEQRLHLSPNRSRGDR